MSRRDFATSGRPVCKNSLFLKIRPLHHSEKRQLNQISVNFHHCHRTDQRYERKAEIMHTARPAPVRFFETTVSVMDIDRNTFCIWVCGCALSVLEACNHANKSTFKFKIGI